MPQRTSQVAIFREAGLPLEVETATVSPIHSRETLVRIVCCTICGSDLHTFSGDRSTPLPSILGHEIIGVVEETAGAVDLTGAPLEVGDRITWSVVVSCGDCPRCASGLPQKCETLFKYGHEAYEQPSALHGGLAEYCVLKPATSVVKLPESLPDAVACPASCATATVAAAMGTAGDLRGKRVLIFGAGMLGLTASAWASQAGARLVAVCDPDAARRGRASQFGAQEVFAGAPAANFDRVFEMSGHPSAVAAAINATDVGATVVLVGSVSPGPPVPVDPETIVRRLLSIHGMHNYAPKDLLAAVDFLNQKASIYPFAELVERSFPLSQVNEAFRFAATHRPVRVAVIPDARH